MLKTDKIVISDSDENRRFDGSQLFVRKPSPLNAAHLAPKLGPVIRIGSHFLIAFSLKLEAPGVSGRRDAKAQHFHIESNIWRAKCCAECGHAADKLGVAKGEHSRYDPAVTFAEKVGL